MCCELERAGEVCCEICGVWVVGRKELSGRPRGKGMSGVVKHVEIARRGDEGMN